MKAPIIVDAISNIKHHLAAERKNGRSVGFVPTMGALHAGHLELVSRAVAENDVAVVSIFVNPKQFNDQLDLKNYPRTLARDIDLLSETGVRFIFTPSEQEIYPSPDTREFDFGILDKVMEGKHRPGHFNGVAQVVSRLFDIVEPSSAYFGLKDYQQLAVIRRMTSMLSYRVKIVPCSIVREADGLAMSSRNMLLPKEIRVSTPLIYKSLLEALSKKNLLTPKETISFVVNNINNDPNLSVEYFELVNAETLEQINSWGDAASIVGCVAVKAGAVRLIDNLVFK